MPENLTEFNDQELLQKKKQQKINAFIFVILFGILVGIATYIATTKGGFIVFIPVILAFICLGKLKKKL